MSQTCTTKGSMNFISVILFAACVLLVTGNAVFAYPYLMLDANPVTYVSVPEESIVTTSMMFTTYALVNSKKKAFDLNGDFYLSVSIVPQLPQTDPLPDIGSFVVDDVVIDIASMLYGNPPAEVELKNKDLPGHGTFNTYYWEHKFKLGPEFTTALYNSQDNPGGPGPIVADGPLYYKAFEFDASGLVSGNNLHIDLYTLTTKKGELVIGDFAPFSHDVLTTPVPGAVLLGMLGLGVAGLKLRKFA